tara:strand:- start:94 stop:732 length:639 start_codon:yes stop_codon:yes gene_type:complete
MKIHENLLWDISILFIGLAILYFFAIGIYYFKNKIKLKKVDKIKQNTLLEYSENQLKNNSKINTPVELCKSYQSIFKSLFDTSDDYCKLLLLDEILEIGNEKDIPFLACLHNHHNPKIRKKALLIKAKLQEKLIALVDVDSLGIKKKKPFDVFEVAFDLEISATENELQFLNNVENKISENIKSEEYRLTKEEHAFFRQLIDFPFKIKETIK